MSQTNRIIKVTLEGEAVTDGRVSVRLLTKTLQSIQDVAIQLGKARLSRDPSLRGRAPEIVERECELFLTEATPGSYHATLELPAEEASLFPELPQFGEAVLCDIRAVMESIASDNPDELQHVIPDFRYRERVIKTLAKCSPSEDSDYHLCMGIGGTGEPLRIVRPSKDKLARLMGAPPVASEGQARRKEGVFQGTFVATVKDDGSPERVLSVIDYEPVEDDMRPFRTSEVNYEGRRFILAHEIACSVGREDHLLVLEYEPLSMRTFGTTRGEVLDEFRETFAFLWDDYAMVPDESLTDDAIQLKVRLLALVKEVIVQ